MFNAYLRVRPQRLPTVPLLSRSYASPKQRGREPGDQRVEIMKRALYPPTTEGGRRGPSPTGVHRSDVYTVLNAVIPSAEAHETITRAWMLHRRQVREAREEDMRRKFECMKQALDELKKVDEKLYRIATYKPSLRKLSYAEREAMKDVKGVNARRAIEAKNEGLFPRELRIPTDTPSRQGWNHDWKAMD
ncbi:hypothetical protein CALVIDRAFT_34644 [Calocera viscosa TUFC12733]|uniref:Large ribosomal subunit protein mL40 n=1 Tax=Calocera viscosa (strain TUFC12733) TaxID=1330018 RepID=A0A167FNG3_CALVF|nr:hypothetical protein CALVIDRAFT_34644 [Calocera viscosa TUFC12733]